MADVQLGELRFYLTLRLETNDGEVIDERTVERNDLKQAGSWKAKKKGKGRTDPTMPAEWWRDQAKGTIGFAVLGLAEDMMRKARPDWAKRNQRKML